MHVYSIEIPRSIAYALARRALRACLLHLPIIEVDLVDPQARLDVSRQQAMAKVPNANPKDGLHYVYREMWSKFLYSDLLFVLILVFE